MQIINEAMRASEALGLFDDLKTESYEDLACDEMAEMPMKIEKSDKRFAGNRAERRAQASIKRRQGVK